MDRFIALANIAHFERLLARETEPDRRRVIGDLLAREKAKLEMLEQRENAGRSPGASGKSGAPRP